MKDATAMDMMMGGGYPWTLEDDKNTSVYIKNATDKPVRAYAVIEFPDGTSYTPPIVDLQPYQTFGIDLRELRDSGQPDVWKKSFPSNGTHGLFVWRQVTPYTLIGRAETTNPKNGVASSFTCGTGCCVQADEDYYFSPDSYGDLVNTTIPVTGVHEVVDCYSHTYEYPDSMGWTSGDSGIAYNDWNGNAVLVGGGQTTLTSFLTISEYSYDTESYSCNSGYHYAFRYASAFVGLSIHHTNFENYDQQGTTCLYARYCPNGNQNDVCNIGGFLGDTPCHTWAYESNIAYTDGSGVHCFYIGAVVYPANAQNCN